jgi:murein L,D-transpeptidase YcbB/YkuD
LKQALANYRELARQPTLHILPPLPHRSIRAGDEYAGAAQLRSLLVALGDLEPDAAAARAEQTTIDDALVAAVQRFQGRHGLDTDGIVGLHTFAALTTPIQHRVRQLELTLERWRWLTAIERPDIVVNVPQFILYAMPRPGEPEPRMLEMPVIVGQSYPHTRTPAFIASIQHVIFQPFWDVPYSIMKRELLPLIREDPSYLERHHMEIVRGPGDDAMVLAPTAEVIDALETGWLRLRQRPGAHNALGAVKFMLPNPYNVYLHSTPQQRLFDRSRRAFSHGCIRVSEPAALAEYVLKNASETWGAEAIEAAMSGTKTLRVKLKTPVRVVIFYSTAATAESAGVLFFEDLYGEDRRLEQLLAVPRGRP